MTLSATSAIKPMAARLVRWLPRSLELQLLLLTSVCLALSIMSYGAYRANAEVAQARHSTSERMVSLAKNIATISAHFLETDEPQSVEPLILQLATVDGIYSVLVTDLAGKPITRVVNQNLVWSPRYGVAPVNVPDPSQPDTRLTTQPYNATQRDFLAGTGGTLTAWQRIGNTKSLGWVQVNYRLDTLDAIAKTIYQQAVQAVALAMLGTLLLLSLLLRPSMRALREATEFASHMDNNMGAQVKVSHRSTEIEALGNALNVLSERLLLQHAELSSQKFALDQHAIVSITDVAGNITYANQRFCDISGYSAPELLGKNHRIVKSDEHPPALFETLWHTISQGQVWHGVVKNRKKDGGFYWVSATIVPLIGRDGLPHHYIGIRTDITVAKLLEEKLRLAKEGAEAASRAKAQFLANMSHEIRTPMNAILGMLRLLHNTALDSRQLDYASKAEGAAQSLLGLINDILDFSKIDADKMTLETRPFRLDRLMRDLSVLADANLGNKPVEIFFEVDPAAPQTLQGDALRLKQVLTNLVGNAVKFTQQGEVRVNVTQLVRTGSHATLRFAVRDGGIDIVPEHQQHVFTGFSQAEASTTRRFGGTGLGLSISRKLVTLMGGELTVQSALGQGSTFSFELTLAISVDALQEPAPQKQPVTSSPSASNVPATALTLTSKPQPLQGLRILVVEDNLINQQVARELLRSEGAHIELANNGQLGVDAVYQSLAHNTPFDVVLMDLQMPVMDGFEAARLLRQDPALSQLPIVAMTANAMTSDREACLAAGMNEHVGKPFNLLQLVTLLIKLTSRA